MHLVVTSARRSRSGQARLWKAYIEGRSNLPALPPGESLHEEGLAFDLATPGTDPFEDDDLAAVGELWRTEYGGTWSETDPVHFQP